MKVKDLQINFGRYKNTGKTLDMVTDSYLLQLHKSRTYPEELKPYIEQRLGITPPKPAYTPCDKFAYPNKKEANLSLRAIKDTDQDHKKPCRSYECPNCGQWHLTSKPKVF